MDKPGIPGATQSTRVGEESERIDWRVVEDVEYEFMHVWSTYRKLGNGAEVRVRDDGEEEEVLPLEARQGKAVPSREVA